MMSYPKPRFLDEYTQWLRTQGKAEGTIQIYRYLLRNMPDDIESFFANDQLRSRDLKVAAYRSYLNFLTKKKNLMSREELMNALDTIKIRQKRGQNNNKPGKAYPKRQWSKYIRKAPTRVAKMGIWIGFHFGLRLSEILHLRIQDINFQTQEILIRSHKQSKRSEAWYPKYNRERAIPFTKEQANTFKRWIQEIRPKLLPHDYLLWTERGPRKDLHVRKRAFQQYCQKTGLTAHDLRRSFATHYYEASGHDVKLISDLLGHANVSTTSEYLQLGKKATMSKARTLFAQA